MAECKHEWFGVEGGVRCCFCDRQLTHEEYRDLLAGHPPEPAEEKPAKPKRTRSKKTAEN